MQFYRFSKTALAATLLLVVASLSGCGDTVRVLGNSSPSADTSSSSMMFGLVKSGTSSSAQTVTLSNTGNTALDISSIVLSGINASSFDESNNCTTSLPAGSSCTISAVFNPMMLGSYTASVTITDNASPSEQTIALTGTSSTIAVSINPATVILSSGQTAQLAATVINTSDQAVTWSILPVGVGSISTSGLFTAPAVITTAQTVTVTATSQLDPTSFSSMTITLVSSVTVSVSPATAALNGGQTVQLSATVTNALNSSVTWSTVFGTITPEGLYTAPSNMGSTLTDTITATSVQDPTKFATATVTVSSGLVGWWPLNEGTGLVAYDISGQGNNGVWSGAPSSPSGTYYTTGFIGSYAGYFDGNDTSVTIGTQPVYRFTGPFTLSAWVNTVSSGTILSMQNGGDNGYNLGINYGVIRFCVYANTTQSCVGGGSYPLSRPAWTYFTAVFDGSNISIYANGVFVASDPAPAPTASTGSLVFVRPREAAIRTSAVPWMISVSITAPFPPVRYLPSITSTSVPPMPPQVLWPIPATVK